MTDKTTIGLIVTRLDLSSDKPKVILAERVFRKNETRGRSLTWEVQGKAEAEVDIRLDASFKVRGKVLVREAAATRKDGSLRLAGIDADFFRFLTVSNRFPQK